MIGNRVGNRLAIRLAVIACLSCSTLAALGQPGQVEQLTAESLLGRTGPDVETAYGERELLRAFRERAVMTAPVNPHYIIGPGDKLVISLWGKRTQTFNPAVDDHGFVSFSIDDTEVRFSVNGLLFKELKDKVVRELARLSSDIDPARPESGRTLVDVTLGEVRGINIMVLGEVAAPGQYTLATTISSVFNALSLAGGLTQQGSLREIRVRRPGGVVDQVDIYSLDLYALLAEGVVDEDLFNLREGDIVIVPPRHRVATISGEIRRPGAYEILEGDTLGRLIELAGDFTAEADPGKIKILRVKADTQARFLNLDFDANEAFALLDGDAIEVVARPPTRRLNIVEIRGEGVRQPGLYEFQPGMTLDALIAEAEGLHEDALSEAAVLVRTAHDFSLEFLTLDLKAMLEGDAAPLELQAQDRLIVYSRYHHEGGDKFVTIAGHVKEPGRYLLSSRMTLADLLFMAGGFNDPDFRQAAWLERADLVRTDRLTQREIILPVNLRALLDGDAAKNRLLQSTDHVRVYAFAAMQDERWVSIAGEVRAPGDYALAEGMTLDDLITVASGMTEHADPDRIEIARFPAVAEVDTRAAELLVVSAADGSAPVLLARNDRIVVRRRTEAREKGVVTLTGEVAYPGDYVLLSRTETVSDLVRRAGGFLRGAAPEAGSLRRGDKPVVIDLERALAAPGGNYDLLLLDGDQLNVPRRDWRVSVEGEVRIPGNHQVIAGRRVSFYIAAAGGYTARAERRQAMLIGPNGRAHRARGFLFSRRVRPGSRIVVPAQTDAEPDPAEHADALSAEQGGPGERDLEPERVTPDGAADREAQAAPRGPTRVTDQLIRPMHIGE